MDFDVVKSEAVLHLASLDESGSAVLLILNESGTGYQTYNINVSESDRYKMLMQESLKMLEEDEE